MKIRNGFVSNSSSSSFIVAVKKPQKNETNYMELIEFMMKNYYKRKDLDKNFKGSIKEYTSNLEKELKKLTKDITFLEKDKIFIEEVLSNKNLIKPIGKLFEYLDNKTKLKKNLGVRQTREFYKNYVPKFVLENELGSINYDIDKIKNKIEILTARISDIQKYKEGSWDIICYEEDAAFGSPMSGAIKELEEKSLAKILKKETT